jgi:Protein of unknown function (DUF4031)
MTVYVDQLFATTPSTRWPYTRACHLLCDGNIQELHAFARRLGLKRSWFQDHHSNARLWHYDLTPGKRAAALKLGAQVIDGPTFARMILENNK